MPSDRAAFGAGDGEVAASRILAGAWASCWESGVGSASCVAMGSSRRPGDGGRLSAVFLIYFSAEIVRYPDFLGEVRCLPLRRRRGDCRERTSANVLMSARFLGHHRLVAPLALFCGYETNGWTPSAELVARE